MMKNKPSALQRAFRVLGKRGMTVEVDCKREVTWKVSRDNGKTHFLFATTAELLAYTEKLICETKASPGAQESQNEDPT